MKNFAITGVAGYIAPRHLQAIKDTGNRLIAALDPHDSVGILDRHFPDVAFFTEFERFDRHLEMLRRHEQQNKIDFLTICAPNHLHDAHIRLAFRLDADAVCEKPLVLNPWNLDALSELERETGKRVFTILQLRVHPALVAIKESLAKETGSARRKVVLTYCTSRGPWYYYSWKGMPEKSGGLATNIGIHFFDLLMWYFGKPQRSEIHLNEPGRAAGSMELEQADVTWFLSIDRKDLPAEAAASGKTTFRSITIDGKEVEFSEGFTDLHTKIYELAMQGKGFGIEDARPSIELVHGIRLAQPTAVKSGVHPFVKR